MLPDGAHTLGFNNISIQFVFFRQYWFLPNKGYICDFLFNYLTWIKHFFKFGLVAFALALSPHKYIYKQMLSQHNIDFSTITRISLFSIHSISDQAKLHAAHIILESITECAWKSTETPLHYVSVPFWNHFSCIVCPHTLFTDRSY